MLRARRGELCEFLFAERQPYTSIRVPLSGQLGFKLSQDIFESPFGIVRCEMGQALGLFQNLHAVRLKHPHHKVRVRSKQPLKSIARDPFEFRFAKRDRRRRAWCLRETGGDTDEIAVPTQTDDRLATRFRGVDKLHQTLVNEIYIRGVIVLPQQLRGRWVVQHVSILADGNDVMYATAAIRSLPDVFEL